MLRKVKGNLGVVGSESTGVVVALGVRSSAVCRLGMLQDCLAPPDILRNSDKTPLSGAFLGT